MLRPVLSNTTEKKEWKRGLFYASLEESKHLSVFNLTFPIDVLEMDITVL